MNERKIRNRRTNCVEWNFFRRGFCRHYGFVPKKPTSSQAYIAKTFFQSTPSSRCSTSFAPTQQAICKISTNFSIGTLKSNFWLIFQASPRNSPPVSPRPQSPRNLRSDENPRSFVLTQRCLSRQFDKQGDPWTEYLESLLHETVVPKTPYFVLICLQISEEWEAYLARSNELLQVLKKRRINIKTKFNRIEELGTILDLHRDSRSEEERMFSVKKQFWNMQEIHVF